jgi:hypothetical protein
MREEEEKEHNVCDTTTKKIQSIEAIVQRCCYTTFHGFVRICFDKRHLIPLGALSTTVTNLFRKTSTGTNLTKTITKYEYSNVYIMLQLNVVMHMTTTGTYYETNIFDFFSTTEGTTTNTNGSDNGSTWTQ